MTTRFVFRDDLVFYQKRRNRFLRDNPLLRPALEQAEEAIRKNPQRAGEAFKGKTWKNYRHVPVESYRLWYVICAERQAGAAFQQAKKRLNLAFQACQFCKVICINMPGESVIPLDIKPHTEQDRLVKGQRRW